MKTIFSITVLMILTFSFGYPQGMDFSGMNVFWEIMDSLEKDIMPSEDKWDELFNTPGYITGNEHEFSHDYFKKFYTLAFMIFGPDGRGYETILVDLVYFLENEERAVSFMAHEMHHYYQNKESVMREGETELLWVIKQIYAEGLADQIDKKVEFFGDGVTAQSDRAKRFRELVDASPNVIRKMDSLIKDIVLNPELYKTNALKISGLVPQSGHPTGYYMAFALLDHAGPESLVEDFGNPFSFLRRNNDMARHSNGKYLPFSNESIQLIGELEERYARY